MENEILYKSISALTKEEQLLFGASCVERILPLYIQFENEISSEQHHFFAAFKNGHKRLNTFLDNIFSLVSESRVADINDCFKFKEECLDLTPDTEEISSNNVVLAQNCSIGLSYVFDFIISGEVKNILYCSDKVIECVDNIIYFQKLDENLKAIAFEKEIQVQKSSIDVVKGGENVPRAEYINSIRTFNKMNLVTFND